MSSGGGFDAGSDAGVRFKEDKVASRVGSMVAQVRLALESATDVLLRLSRVETRLKKHPKVELLEKWRSRA